MRAFTEKGEDACTQKRLQMKFYVAVTDDNWFRRLRDENPMQPINFWRPTTRRFRALKTGGRFFFKLHSPKDFVVGGGTFLEFKRLTSEAAWREFGTRNGTRSELELQEQLTGLREKHNMGRDIQFGCIVLECPFFLSDSDWIRIHDVCDWKRSIVQGRIFDSESDGKALWDALRKVQEVQQKL
jgi:putative restriction endonuclease